MHRIHDPQLLSSPSVKRFGSALICTIGHNLPNRGVWEPLDKNKTKGPRAKHLMINISSTSPRDKRIDRGMSNCYLAGEANSGGGDGAAAPRWRTVLNESPSDRRKVTVKNKYSLLPGGGAKLATVQRLLSFRP